MWGFGSPASRGEPCGGSVPPAGRGNLQEGVRKILLRTPRVCVYALAGLQTALRVCVYALAGLQTAPRVCVYAPAGLQYTDAVFVPLACTVCLLTDFKGM
jgi:hypothetical protein